MQNQNPFEAPAPSTLVDAEEVIDKSKVKLARLSWQLPLAAFGASIIINMVTTSIVAQPVRMIGGFFFLAGIAAGWVFSIVSLVLAFRHRGVLGHAIAGLIVNAAFSALIFVLFAAVLEAREGVRERSSIQKCPTCETIMQDRA